MDNAGKFYIIHYPLSIFRYLRSFFVVMLGGEQA